MKHYWFRGLLDGDGTIHTDNLGNHSMGFSSSKNQNWNYLEQLCNKLNIKYFIKRSTNSRVDKRNGKKSIYSSSSFSIFGMYKTIKFCEYLYKGYPKDKIGLKRKYKKFLKMKKTEKKNRYKGVCKGSEKSKYTKGKWRAFVSMANGEKNKTLGFFKTKKEALKHIKEYYKIYQKSYLHKNGFEEII